MQSNRTTPPRVAGTGTAVLMLLLGVLLIAAALYWCLSILRPQIETDLTARVGNSVQDIGISTQNFQVVGQDVTLAGVVDSDASRREAESRIANVYGVARVYNNLRLPGEAVSENRTSAPSAGLNSNAATTETSPAVTSSLSDNLVLDESLSPSTLDISVNAGLVTVQGIVPDKGSIERIIKAASDKFGAQNVEDDMSTYIGSAKPRWLDDTIAYLSQIENVESPFIKITHAGASVGGTVDSEDDAQRNSATAINLLGNYLEVKTDFSVKKATPPTPSPEAPKPVIIKGPASLEISNQNGVAMIAGVVNSEREAQAIRDGASNLFSSNYEDRLLVDNSVAPAEWIAEAIAVANNVRGVEDFAINIDDGVMQLNGVISDRITGRSLAGTAADIASDKLTVVNNFSPSVSGPVALTGEELLAEELQRELDALDTAAIVFKRGSSELTDSATLVLNEVADVIMNYRALVIEIAGHTDSSGDDLSNMELSRQRAIAVQEYLIDRQVPEARLRPIGYGETNPIADNLTPEGQAANRRIEFKL